jgi:hypothetical protein
MAFCIEDYRHVYGLFYKRVYVIHLALSVEKEYVESLHLTFSIVLYNRGIYLTLSVKV